MNTPGTTVGNWRWRFDWQQVPQGLAARIRQLLAAHRRQLADPSEATLPTQLKA
ncbi:MAG: hypothetical protein IPG64_20335 [Haliea sp.]|nr:hypothetical protein [Haliea sp.]